MRLNDGGVRRLAENLEQIVVAEEIEARKRGSLLLKERKSQKRMLPTSRLFLIELINYYYTSRNSLSARWHRFNWSVICSNVRANEPRALNATSRASLAISVRGAPAFAVIHDNFDPSPRVNFNSRRKGGVRTLGPKNNLRV